MQITNPNDVRLGMFYSCCCEQDVRTIDDQDELQFVKLCVEAEWKFPDTLDYFARREYAESRLVGPDADWFEFEIGGFTGCWDNYEEAVKGSE